MRPVATSTSSLSSRRNRANANRLQRAASATVDWLEPRRLLCAEHESDMLPEEKQALFIQELHQSFATDINGVGTTHTVEGGAVNVGPVVNISRASGNQTEADIAINPVNPQQIFAVSNVTSNGLFMAVSNDGGVNWTTRTGATGADIPTACCDARVEYDSFGNLWMTYLGPGGSNNYVARSINNGTTFTIVDTKTGSWDNPAIAVGHGNNIVAVEARGPGGVNVYTGVSTGLGAPITFTAAQSVPTTSSTGNFGDVAVLNDGSILVTYTTPSGGQGPATDPVYRDPDGIGVGAGFSLVLTQNTNVGGFDFLPAQDGRSVDSEPQFAVAPPNTPFAGRVYFIYLEEKVAENNDTDVMLRYSDNGGLNWTTPVVVNDDNQSIIRSQMLQQIAVDRTTGAIALSWHDARNDNGVLPNGTNAVANDDVQFYGAVSLDGGVTFENFQITSGWSNDDRAANGIDFGDWTGSDFYNGVFHAIWADNSQGAGGIPNNPTPNSFDLATARVEVFGAGGSGIFGAVFDDADGDGTRDPGEAGIGSTTVYLDANNSGGFDPGEATAVTNFGGSYSFTGLADGNYIVRSLTPAGRRPTGPVGGAYNVTINAGTPIAVNQNFGFVNPTIAGTAFTDTNDNGIFDASELVRAGVTVFIDSNNNGSLDGGEPNQVTTAAGTYAFTGLADGSYVVRIQAPAGTRQTVPGGSSYSLSISNAQLAYAGQDFGVTTAARIQGVVFNDLDGDGVRDVGENGIANARVFIDTNNNGTFDNLNFDFTQNTPLALPDDRVTRFSDLVISNTLASVNDIGVRFNITHTFIGDLDIFLISPAGTRIELTTDNGSSSDGANVTLLQSAANSVTTWPTTTGTGPITGTWRPEGDLTSLNGQPLDGTWRLEITDDAGGDSGNLVSWGLFQGFTEPNVLTPADGSYKFTPLAAGNYVVRQLPLAGNSFTTPPGGVYNITAAAADLLNRDFGNNSAFSSSTGFYVRLNGPGDTIQIFRNTTGAGSPDFELSYAGTPAVNLVGGGSADQLIVDLVNGSPIPTGGINFDGGAGSDSVLLVGSGGADDVTFVGSTIVFGAGSINYSGTEAIEFDGGNGNDSLTYAGSTATPTFLGQGGRNTLNVEAAWTYDVDAATQNSQIDVIVARNKSLTLNASQHLTSLYVSQGASANLAAGAGFGVVAPGLIRTGDLTVEDGGTIDLSNGALIVDYSTTSPLAALRTLLQTGYAGGGWNGTGIRSSTAAGSPLGDALGNAEASAVFGSFPASFFGESVDSSTALVRYTLYGDADLTGTTDIDDFGRLAASFNGAGEWSSGDFNYSGIVDIDDFGLLAANFNQGVAGSGARVASAAAAGASPATGVFATTPIGQNDDDRLADDVLNGTSI